MTILVSFPQVINFELPQTAAGYVHRIGRTGRAHNTGASVSLVSVRCGYSRTIIYLRVSVLETFLVCVYEMT